MNEEKPKDLIKGKQIYCPLCEEYFEGSEYLDSVFKENEKVKWFANIVTHYRHTHITSWNKCWEYGGNSYRRNWFGNYEDEKIKVNERAKRQIIRKAKDYLKYYKIDVDTVNQLQNTTEETRILATKLLSE